MKKNIKDLLGKLNPLKKKEGQDEVKAKGRSAAKKPAAKAEKTAKSQAAVKPKIKAETKDVEKKPVKAPLPDVFKFEHAPKGSVQQDFKAALYCVCARFHPDFGSISGLGVISGLLGQVGYAAGGKAVTAEIYNETLQELVADGALVKLPGYAIYAHPSQVHAGVSKVTAHEEADFLSEERGKRYVYHVIDSQGQECRVRSSLVILPGDEVEFDAVAGVAYVKNLSKKRVCVLGRVMLLGREGRVAAVMPDEPNLSKQVFEYDSVADLGDAKSGDVVIAEIVERRSSKCLVKTREVVRDLGNLNNIIVMAVLRNDIPSSWPENMPKALSRIPDHVEPEDYKGRNDLREVPLMTIDGEDARDFDDAVYCQREGDKWRLYVAIADVSYYVRPGTVLDKEAVNRCNSCYFPNYVIPMLPEKLSNGICSLNPDVERLCMCCEMIVNKEGRIEKYEFYPAVMRSHARLTYNEAWQMISEGHAKFPEHEFAVPNVKELYALYKAFVKDRRRRGGIAIESTEQHFVFNEDMEITGVEPLERNDAHKLIEECMIAANVAAACFVAEHKSQTLYRVHAKPTEKKLATLLPQLARFGLSLTGGESPEPRDYARLSDAIAKRKDAKMLGELLLRSMSKAEYTPENIGHFGLALEKYAHFTSPIRRYADLQLHRVIKHILEKQGHSEWGKIGSKTYTKPELTALGEKCTQRELSADIAEREVDFELACVYLEKFIGETVEGTITGCTRFGIFVHLDKFLVDGLIYIGNFPGYMNFDQRTESLISDRGKVYRIGDPIKVVIAAVNAQEHKVDLMPTGLGSTAKYKKVRDRVLKEREKAKENAQVVDKEDMFRRLSDIASAKDATEGDNVERAKVQGGWGSELSSMMHFADPFAMPAKKGERDGRERDDERSRRKRKGKKHGR